MPLKLTLLCCLLVVSAAGCLVSEQIGEPEGSGTGRIPGKDVTIHFDTDFNRLVLFGRSAALAAFALWIMSAWKMKPGAVVVGGGLIVAAAWFVIRDYPKLEGYWLEVAPQGLTLRVPPDLDTLIAWEAIQQLELEGFGYSRIGGAPATPYSVRTSVNLELPDWRTMKLVLADGQSHTILLEELSIEQRQIFAKALIKRADLVEID